jgi:glycosyltransferase involved in cell wall biosynthesis
MRISLFLPHVGVFGGVRRFVELGNAWGRTGHEVTLYHPGGERPAWLAFSGAVEPLAVAATRSTDLALCADPHTLDAFLAHGAGARVYYCVLEGDPGAERAAARPEVRLAANSGRLVRHLSRRTGRSVLDGIGGIAPGFFLPDPARRAAAPLRVLLNGRRSRPKKGTDLALRALRGLAGRVPEFEIVLFDSLGPQNRQDPRDGAPLPANARFVLDPTQEELRALYQSAHVFVAAERKAGWCNTALEAMACGVAVVCTTSGTADFARHGDNALVVPIRHELFLRPPIARLLRDRGLRERLGGAGPATAAKWSWDILAAKLMAQIGRPGETEQRR